MFMWIVKPATLKGYWESCPDSESGLRVWMARAQLAHWRNIQEVRRDYPHADAVMTVSGAVATVFNLCGNKYRLITAIHYNTGKVFVMRFFTQYSKDRWKDQL